MRRNPGLDTSEFKDFDAVHAWRTGDTLRRPSRRNLEVREGVSARPAARGRDIRGAPDAVNSSGGLPGLRYCSRMQSAENFL